MVFITSLTVSGGQFLNKKGTTCWLGLSYCQPLLKKLNITCVDWTTNSILLHSPMTSHRLDRTPRYKYWSLWDNLESNSWISTDQQYPTIATDIVYFERWGFWLRSLFQWSPTSGMTYWIVRFEAVIDEPFNDGCLADVLVSQQDNFILYFSTHCRRWDTHSRFNI